MVTKIDIKAKLSIDDEDASGMILWNRRVTLKPISKKNCHFELQHDKAY